jgi:small subunit ribosomal protein S1
MPSYIADAEELEFERKSRRHVPPPAPLVPHAQLRALAADLISAPTPGELDIPALVNVLAQGCIPAVLPRSVRKGTARRIRIIIDTADSMRLFEHDARDLMTAIHALAGSAVRSARVMHGPPPGRQLRGASRGDTILAFSDLGIGSIPSMRGARIAAWRDFAAAQQSRGINVTAIVPLHRQRWPSSLKSRMRMVQWHRPGTTSVPSTNADLRKLALVLSRAAVIDPALLRRARMKVLPAADAGAEADFVIRPWTAVYNPRVIALSPSWVVHLRSELARDDVLRDVAESLLQRPTTSDWKRVIFEEEIVRASLDASDKNPEALKNALARVIRTLLGKVGNAETARWALCFLDELSEEVRKTEAAQLLRAVALIALISPDDEVAKIVAEHNAQWVFGKKALIGVLWTGEFVVAREPPRIGDRIVEVPATWPRILIYEETETGFKKVLRIFSNDQFPAWARATRLPKRLKTIAGGEYEIESFAEAWQALVRAFANDEPVEGVVGAFLPKFASFVVDIGFTALLPAQQLLLGPEEADLTGKSVKVRITSIVNATREITVALADQAEKRFSDEAWENIRTRFNDVEPLNGILRGSTKRGWVVDIGGIRVFVPSSELTQEDYRTQEELAGRELPFAIAAIDDEKRRVFLSRMLSEYESWRAVIQAYRSDRPIKGRVTDLIKGGLSVDVDGIKAFLPGSLIDTKPIRDLDTLRDHEYKFKIVSFDRKRNNLVLSRRAILEIEQAAQKAETLGRLQEGKLTHGIVKNITDYGVFVDLGGIDGLLHITDISWARVTHPSEYFKLGDEIEVLVLRFDPAAERVSLGYKQKGADPWDTVAQRYPVGTVISGRVSKLADFGAFVEIEEGVEALIHVSEMSWTKKVQPSKLLKVDDKVEAVVTGIDVPKRRLALSMKALEKNPWDAVAQRYPVGSVISGRVRNLTDFGAFVEIEDGIDGLIHISDMSWNRRIKHPHEVLKKDDKVQARVTKIDSDNQRLTLSIKEFLPNKWEDFANAHNVGDEIVGTIAKITDFGLFIRVDDGVEGLVHVSEVPRDSNTRLGKLFNIGEEVLVRIIKIDFAENKIGLSMLL